MVLVLSYRPRHIPMESTHNDGRFARSLTDGSMRPALRLAAWFALAKLLLQFALTLWTIHLGYGYFRDEFYFLMCGRHLAWGYVDQGPMVAVQARLGEILFGDSVFAIRVLSAVGGALTVGLGGLITWALGGRRPAQALAMFALLVVPVYIGVDGYLCMSSSEPVFWMGCIFALLLLQQGAPPRECWLTIGALSGVGLLNKPSMLFFLAALVLGLLLTPQRRLLKSDWFFAAAALALLIVSPFLAWQFHHAWPTWQFLRNGQIEGKNKILGPLAFLWAQIAQMHPVNALLWVPGLVALLRAKTLRDHRWMGWTYLLFLALMLKLHAKDYYLAPIYPMLFAAGGVAWERRFAHRDAVAKDRILGFPILESVLLVTGLIVLPLASPVLPPQTWARYTHALHLQPGTTENARTSILPQFFADRFGWTELASDVVSAYRALPPQERQHVCIIANNYGEAASLEFLGKRLEPNLPPVISGHNNYWLWGMRGCTGDTLIAVVHDTPAELATKYASVTVVGQLTNPLAMPYEHKHIYLLRDRRSIGPFDWNAERDFI